MNDNEKFIKKLDKKDRERIEYVISRILKGDIRGLDVKRLRGHFGIFRVRVGSFRVIYHLHKELGFIVVKVTRKNDTTYNL